MNCRVAASPEPMDQLRRWFMVEYIHRTLRVLRGEAQVMEIEPGNRLPFSEVSEKARALGIAVDDDLPGFREAMGDWTRWITRINRFDLPALERELAKLETAA